MRTVSALAFALASLISLPASAHDAWSPPAVVIDNSVWANPGVYVSQNSAVTRDYPYVGCCLPPYENSSYMRPYPSGFGLRTSRVALPRYSQRRAIGESPPAADHLHYPDGRAIERFR